MFGAFQTIQLVAVTRDSPERAGLRAVGAAHLESAVLADLEPRLLGGRGSCLAGAGQGRHVPHLMVRAPQPVAGWGPRDSPVRYYR